ncbi:MAG: exodeoxyribonuclease VII small subunit [Fimbriimonadaceae bacterium]|nr:exodeoxyribonuclease VII small subunit [Chthonomonadaceae bacterium]MCO5296528.1 exodeoxyribonuclease VII small subunit [Fimbriimonadaceae bacterium]
MKPKEPTYAEASERLGAILQQLRDGSVEIDDLAQVVEEAATLLSHCRKKLRAVEAKVEKIAAELDEADDDPFDGPEE